METSLSPTHSLCVPPAGENRKEHIFTQSFIAYSCQPGGGGGRGGGMKYAENFTDAIITCSWPSLAAPGTCLVLWTWQTSPTFSQNGMFYWKDVGDSNELRTFPWNGKLPKKATTATQPNGNHDISLNSEPDLPFFFSFIETFCVPCALGAKKKSYFGSLFLFAKLRYCKYPPLLS